MEGESDDKRRLGKALLVNEKLKAKYQFEKEVSKELAGRNDMLKKELVVEAEKSKTLLHSLDDVMGKAEKLFDLIAGKDLSDAEVWYMSIDLSTMFTFSHCF